MRFSHDLWSTEDFKSISSFSIFEVSTLVLATSRCEAFVSKMHKVAQSCTESFGYDLPKKFFCDLNKGVTWKFGIKLTWWMPTWCPVGESTNRIVESHPRPLLDNSVDVVLCDLPFGRQFGTLDTWPLVGDLLRHGIGTQWNVQILLSFEFSLQGSSSTEQGWFCKEAQGEIMRHLCKFRALS